jgi:hypothetical protein
VSLTASYMSHVETPVHVCPVNTAQVCLLRASMIVSSLTVSQVSSLTVVCGCRSGAPPPLCGLGSSEVSITSARFGTLPLPLLLLLLVLLVLLLLPRPRQLRKRRSSRARTAPKS